VQTGGGAELSFYDAPDQLLAFLNDCQSRQQAMASLLQDGATVPAGTSSMRPDPQPATALAVTTETQNPLARFVPAAEGPLYQNQLAGATPNSAVPGIWATLLLPSPAVNTSVAPAGYQPSLPAGQTKATQLVLLEQRSMRPILEQMRQGSTAVPKAFLVPVQSSKSSTFPVVRTASGGMVAQVVPMSTGSGSTAAGSLATTQPVSSRYSSVVQSSTNRGNPVYAHAGQQSMTQHGTYLSAHAGNQGTTHTGGCGHSIGAMLGVSSRPVARQAGSPSMPSAAASGRSRR
jgi:hypothetical protein